jgi:transposase
MLQITPQMKVLVAVDPVDFRKGIDGLSALCKATLQQDPFAGTVFVFRNRRATAIKVLFFGCAKNACRPVASGGGPLRLIDRRAR